MPADREAQPVQRCGALTAARYAWAAWRRPCQIDPVVMESTGVYWMALGAVLEERGCAVKLVDAQQARPVPGRQTDVQDGPWRPALPTSGFLRGALRPEDAVCVVRSSRRQRRMRVAMAARAVQHLQKALEQMPLKLTEVGRDLTGQTGLTSIRAMRTGERAPQ